MSSKEIRVWEISVWCVFFGTTATVQINQYIFLRNTNRKLCSADFVYFYLCVNVCFCVCAYTCEYSIRGDQKRAMYPPRARVPDSCEQHHVGAGNYTQSSEKQHSMLTAEPSLKFSRKEIMLKKYLVDLQGRFK